MTPPLVQLTGVVKDYHGLRPLRIAELTVLEAEHVAIVGFDGPAAEMFVNLVTGTTLPDAGEVRLFGRPTSAIADSADWLATVDRFGIVSERAVLLDQLTVIQNLAMPFTLDIEPPADDARRQATGLAQEVGIAESIWEQPIAGFDREARTRLRLARALALDPAVLLLEHVSAGLSTDVAAALGRDIRSIATRRGAALIALTADEALANNVGRPLQWDPVTGRLTPRRSGGWFRRLLG